MNLRQEQTMTDEAVMQAMDRIGDECVHVAEADRLTALAKSDDPAVGPIERVMYLTEASNHLLRAVFSRLT